MYKSIFFSITGIFIGTAISVLFFGSELKSASFVFGTLTIGYLVGAIQFYYYKKETLILKSEKTIHFSNGEILGITQEMSDKIREAILDNMTNLLCVSNEKGKTIHIINLKEVSFIS
jgi:hypothetical protein